MHYGLAVGDEIPCFDFGRNLPGAKKYRGTVSAAVCRGLSTIPLQSAFLKDARRNLFSAQRDHGKTQCTRGDSSPTRPRKKHDNCAGLSFMVRVVRQRELRADCLKHLRSGRPAS